MRIGGFIAKLSCEMVLLKHKFLGGKKLMKNFSKIFAGIAKKSAESALKRDANTTTCTAIYQPKAPKSLKQFSKFDK